MEFDYGNIRITPNIQDRVNEMKRRRAEEDADRQQRIALTAHQLMKSAHQERDRLAKANSELQLMLHAAMGWPVRVMLPAPM